jgi:membrane protein
LRRALRAVAEHEVLLYASSFAFFAFLSVFPALAALISLHSLTVDPTAIDRTLEALRGLVPDNIVTLLSEQIEVIARASAPVKGGTLAIGLALALWSAAQAVKALIAGLNAAYKECETRGFVQRNGVALWLALAGLLFGVLALGLIAALPPLLDRLALPGGWWLGILRWPLLGAIVMALLAVLYRIGPCRRQPRWQWVSWGAALATLLWLATSALFSLYVTHFGVYNHLYGTLGAIVFLLLWIYASGVLILLGGEFNAAAEEQTGVDTTEGASQPLGQRGARAADTVG